MNKLIKISWLVSNLKNINNNEIIESDLASNRMRIGVCLKACKSSGLEIMPINLIDTKSYPNILFVGKYVHDSGTGLFMQDGGARWSEWLATIREAKKCGTKIVIDYTDNHLAGSDIRSNWYQEVINYVDAVIVPSEMMKENAKKYFDCYIYVIEEPIEFEVQPFNNPINSNPLKIIWFGHASNQEYLYKFISTKAVFLPEFELTVLSNGFNENQNAIIQKKLRNGIIKFEKWSLEGVKNAAKLANFSLIPSDINDVRKNGVSANRLISSLALGLMPIATILDSYKPYEDYIINIDDTNKLVGLNHYFSTYEEIVSKFQNKELNKFLPHAIEPKWINCIKDLLEN